MQDASECETEDIAPPHTLLVPFLALDRLLDQRNELVERPSRIEFYFDVSRSADVLGAATEDLFVGAAGTPARFLMSFAAGAKGASIVTGNERLCERPMDDLINALTAIGVRVECVGEAGRLPVRVHGGDPSSQRWTISGGISSQFVSSLILHAAQQKSGPIQVALDGPLVSRPYVEMASRPRRKPPFPRSCARRGCNRS